MKEKSRNEWFESLDDLAMDSIDLIRDMAQEKGYDFGGLIMFYAGMMTGYANAVAVRIK